MHFAEQKAKACPALLVSTALTCDLGRRIFKLGAMDDFRPSEAVFICNLKPAANFLPKVTAAHAQEVQIMEALAVLHGSAFIYLPY